MAPKPSLPSPRPGGLIGGAGILLNHVRFGIEERQPRGMAFDYEAGVAIDVGRCVKTLTYSSLRYESERQDEFSLRLAEFLNTVLKHPHRLAAALVAVRDPVGHRRDR